MPTSPETEQEVYLEWHHWRFECGHVFKNQLWAPLFPHRKKVITEMKGLCSECEFKLKDAEGRLGGDDGTAQGLYELVDWTELQRLPGALT